MEAEIVLVALPQADGQVKRRPALVLREMPPFGDLLVAGISSQLQQAVAGFDEVLHPADEEFANYGLRSASVVRLGFLTVLPQQKVVGTLGTMEPVRYQALLQRLTNYLLRLEAKAAPSDANE